MKNLLILAALGTGFYLVTQNKEKIKKPLQQLTPTNIVDDLHQFVRPNKTPGTNNNSGSNPVFPTSNPNGPVNNQYSEIPSGGGRIIMIEDGTLDLGTELMGYKAYHNDANGNWVPKIPRVPQYIGNLEGKIFFSEFGEVYVIQQGKSYRVFVSNPIEKWGILYPQNAIPVSNVPMYFLDTYPKAGIMVTSFTDIVK